MNDKQNMIRLNKQGYSYGAIASLYGLSRQRIHQIISGYGKNNNALHHSHTEYYNLHSSVLERDNHTCQKCGSKTNLVVHHIDGDDNNNIFNNLITLCNTCHLNLHRPKNHNGIIGKKHVKRRDKYMTVLALKFNASGTLNKLRKVYIKLTKKI